MEEVPEGFELVAVTFGEGSLGVTLRRLKDSGKVAVLDVVSDSQAVGLDVSVGDEIWAVGEIVLGAGPVDEEAWRNMLQHMKSTRPLLIAFLRESASKPSSPVTSALEERSVNFAEAEAASTSSRRSSGELEAEPAVNEQTETQRPPLMRMRSKSAPEPFTSQDKRLSPELEQLYSRISVKQTALGALKLMTQSASDDQKRAFLLASGVDLFKRDQCLYFSGEVGLLGSFALLNMQRKRHMVLLGDVLVLFGIGQSLEYESTIDLLACKVNERVRTGNPTTDASSFDLLLDGEEGESIRIVCRSEADRREWVEAIFTRIFDLWGKPDTFAWKHGYLLGSIHSLVIEGNVEAVKELVAMCDAGQCEYDTLETPDEQGFTPLMYAVILKKRELVSCLLQANPDVTVKDEHGLSALHWAALHLDGEAVSALCDHTLEGDVDAPDKLGRSALFLACAEGKDENGESDSSALASCISSLAALGANMNVEMSDKGFPIHFVAAGWQDEALDALLKGGGRVHAVTAAGTTALHAACQAIPLRTAAIEMTRILFGSTNREDALESVHKEGAARTLLLLLKSGARPNSKDGRGRSPLQLLLEARDVWSEDLFDAVELLVSWGARADEDVRAKCPPGFIDEAVAVWTEKAAVDIGSIGLKEKCFAVGFTVERPLCSLCDSQFTLFRRKQKCPLCSVTCCDDCSRKKVSIDDVTMRVCDGCFNLSTERIGKAREDAFKASFNQGSKPAIPVQSTAPAPARKVSLSERASLFSGSVDKKKASEVSAASRAIGSMNEARQNLMKRGEMLEATAEKSEELVNASSEFAKLAKQLKEKQKNKWF